MSSSCAQFPLCRFADLQVDDGASAADGFYMVNHEADSITVIQEMIINSSDSLSTVEIAAGYVPVSLTDTARRCHAIACPPEENKVAPRMAIRARASVEIAT